MERNHVNSRLTHLESRTWNPFANAFRVVDGGRGVLEILRVDLVAAVVHEERAVVLYRVGRVPRYLR